MAKPELGVKRLCAECGAKFYDLNREPPVCPKCQTVFEIPVPAGTRVVPEPKKEEKPEPAPAPEPEAAPEKVEVISLEEADAEQTGEEVPEIDDSDIEDVDTDIGGDQAFLEADDEDDGDDVSDIVAPVKKDEE